MRVHELKRSSGETQGDALHSRFLHCKRCRPCAAGEEEAGSPAVLGALLPLALVCLPRGEEVHAIAMRYILCILANVPIAVRKVVAAPARPLPLAAGQNETSFDVCLLLPVTKPFVSKCQTGTHTAAV